MRHSKYYHNAIRQLTICEKKLEQAKIINDRLQQFYTNKAKPSEEWNGSL